MEKEYIVGIDFGHGETSAWIVPLNLRNGQLPGEALQLSPANNVANRSYYSAIYFTPDNGFSLGNMAGDVVTEFKNKVENLNQDKRTAYTTYIQAIYKRLLLFNNMLRRDDDNGETNFYLCIACPTKWTQAEKLAYINFFNEALRIFNIEVLWVINESDAAYFTHGSVGDYQNQCVLIIDYGSSTIDYTVVYNGKKISEDNWSNQLGANNIEEAILQEYRETEHYREKYQNTQTKLQEIHTNINICSSLKFAIRKAKEVAVTQGDYPYFGLSYNLIGMQTGYGQTQEFRHNRDKYKFEINCDIDQIEPFQDYFNKVCGDFRRLKQSIQQRIGDRRIDLVILSGGACQMPWVRGTVEQIFTPRRIYHDGQASFVVAKGIALYARAQLKALEDFLNRIEQLNFCEMYIEADTKATATAVNTMMPNMKQDLRSSASMTGIVIRQNFCNFIQGLNENNEYYCEIVKNKFNILISEKIRSNIKSVIQEVFNVDVDVADVNLNISIQVMNWHANLFNPGGAFYNAFTKWIEESSGRWSFTWDIPREGAELSRIVDGTAEKLIQLVNSGQIADYPQEVLNTYSENVKKIVINKATEIFYQKQLFNTTFKNERDNG